MSTTPAHQALDPFHVAPPNTKSPKKNDPSEQLAQFERTFTANITYFAHHHPELHHFAVQHQPQNTFLAIDDRGHPNLFTNKKPFYHEDPVEHSKHYLNRMAKNPIAINYMHSSDCKTPPPKNSLLHLHYLFEIESLLPEKRHNAQIPAHGIVPLCAIIGVGTGHIIAQITDHYDVQNLLIYEPNSDIFYASLFVTNYRHIAERYQKDYRSLTFIIGANSSVFCNRVDALFHQHGHFLLSRLLLVDHRPTHDTQTAITHLKGIIHRSEQGWGFFEDEIISVSQSLHNLHRGTRLIAPTPPSARKNLKNIPVFIIANGPSLDRDIAFIKAHIHCAIVVSVGSTLYSLYRHGIKPDYHVEIERSPDVGAFLERFTDPEYLKSITLLTQNPIHPSVIAQFSQTFMSLKVNDAGTRLMQLVYSVGKKWPLYCTHPLVGNGGVATLIRLGFTQLYLFGMDLCVTETGQHHSACSAYYDEDDRRLPAGVHFEAHYRARGNFAESVPTNALYDTSRFVIELLIEEHPEVTAINCSDGIRIRGTKSRRSSDISLRHEGADGKKAALAYVLAQTRVFKGHSKSLRKRYLKAQCAIAELANGLCRLWPDHVNDMRTITQVFIEQQSLLPYFNQKDPLSEQMLSGSLRYLQTYLYRGALQHTEGPDLERYLSRAKNLFVRYMKSMLALSTHHFDALYGTFDRQKLYFKSPLV